MKDVVSVEILHKFLTAKGWIKSDPYGKYSNHWNNLNTGQSITVPHTENIGDYSSVVNNIVLYLDSWGYFGTPSLKDRVAEFGESLIRSEFEAVTGEQP